jgi:hypothetical protein
MNAFKRVLLTVTLIACTASVFAAPTDITRPEPHNNGRSNFMGPPPAPLYLIMQQTDSPNETLSNTVKNMPTLEKGKRYEVRLEVKELPPAPQGIPAPQ